METLIISSSIWTKSPLKNLSGCSVKVRTSSTVVNVFPTPVVVAVDTTGDWIILSIVIRVLGFWFFAVIKCPDPIPTPVISSVVGLSAKASVALAATLTRSSSCLTMNNVDGNLSVTPIPGMSVEAIPIGPLIASNEYTTSSPVTKKCCGSSIVSWVTLVIPISDPSNFFWKIGFPSWNNSKSLRTEFSVPW